MGHTLKRQASCQRDFAINRGQDEPSWLNRNISSIIAILIIVSAFTFFVYILNFDFSENSKLKDIVILLIGIISTLATTVVNYYFGSSLGSSAKTKIMQNRYRAF